MLLTAVVVTKGDRDISEVLASLSGFDELIVPQHRRSEYAGSQIALLGWGTIFRKQLLRVFDPYLARYGVDELFYRECDRIFSFMCHDFTRFVDVSVQ